MGPAWEADRRISMAVRSNSRELSLARMGLTELPRLPVELRGLEALNLSDNEIHALPHWLADFPSLRELNLSNNGLSTFPEPITALAGLQLLILRGNGLTSLPESISHLRRLEVLDVSDNKLTALPKALLQMKHLRRLEIIGNPQLDIPVDITSTRTAVFLDHYAKTRFSQARPLNEAKLILVGRGEVGKTSLVQRLVRNQFDVAQAKTDGIQITKWPVKIPDEVLLHVWDFGGQEIMHATHQFFLTERSLYLVVLNGREGGEDADVEYWLKLIDSFGGDSPVIIVLNKIEGHPFDLNRSGLQQKYPGRIRAFVRTDCASSMGIEDLRADILNQINKLPHLRTLFPQSWFDIKKRLTGMRENFLTFDRFQEICTQLGETNPESQSNLATILHCLGAALNYKDDPRLRDTHVLNPRWVTNGIYKILNAPLIERQQGELSLKDMRQILDNSEYPSGMHDFLLNLMRKFELCFRFPDPKDDVFLIPQLLGKQQPAEVAGFGKNGCLRFRYAYPIWPEGVLPRFIVRTHALSMGQPRWRTGVILEFESNRALVMADPEEKIVDVVVDGPAESRRRLLAIIRSDFERIHSDFPKLNPDSRVPLPEAPDQSIAYRDLLVFETNGRSQMEIVSNGKLQSIGVSTLLNSIDLPNSYRKYRESKLFISYSHKDEDLRAELDAHLKIFQRQGLIRSWHDRRITPGDEWKAEIDRNLDDADIVLMLISADFVASEYCYEIEMKRAMQRHAQGSCRVVPVVIRECVWDRAPFSKIQALPKDGKAVKLWADRDAAWSDVARGLERC